MEVTEETIGIIEETLRRRRKDESFERTLGKVLRRRKLSFDEYISIMAVLRERMRHGLNADEAARLLCSEKMGKKEDDD
ncbi:MAG: hypothetical protein KIY12_07165 [Thermoplasmata archaeon]|uniref:Uncharacterized protein n=1 Tax=Candidatus Sysuiplasma superficiale TaxID=2823368 RepID=A0A8J8CBA4_9ARCH|nr:hypothetical protein [Candidatus Sysuiplasma superficiale]MBX8644483.1 hypothetical protein [Candidatus Sysuiplasma superficiale]MCL4346909.1 hypothetical protein [Candidatus Thermoplasmatota archaeon]